MDIKSYQKNNNDDSSISFGTFLAQAMQALDEENYSLAIHLYLAAYHEGVDDPFVSSAMNAECLVLAWEVAYKIGDAFMAESILGHLEKYFTPEEMLPYQEKIKQLVTKKLIEFDPALADLDLDAIQEQLNAECDTGLISYDDDDMSEGDVSSEIFFSGDTTEDIEEEQEDLPEDSCDDHSHEETLSKSVQLSELFQAHKEELEKSKQAKSPVPVSANKNSKEQDATEGKTKQVHDKHGIKEPPSLHESQKIEASHKVVTPSDARSKVKKPKEKVGLNYSNLIGYKKEIDCMNYFGVGLKNDSEFNNFLKMMNARHGMQSTPSLDTFVLRAARLDDASRFAAATAGEIGLPAACASLEINDQLELVVTMGSLKQQKQPRIDTKMFCFKEPAVFVLEGIDQWEIPNIQPLSIDDDIEGYMAMPMPKIIRDLLLLVQSAAKDPKVQLIATCTDDGIIDPFVFDLIGPSVFIDIEKPDHKERELLWREVKKRSSIFDNLDTDMLAHYSKGLSRADIFESASNINSDYYRKGILERLYRSVSKEDLLMELEKYQDPSSPLFKEIERDIIQEFRKSLTDVNVNEFLSRESSSD